MSGDKKIKKFIGITATMLGTVFAGLEIWAKIKKDNSVYKNEPSEQNPMEGKKVVFIEDDNDLENADGVRGHLEAIGDSDYHPGFYEKYVKRALDVVLSFGGLVVLSPVFIGLSIAIFIDDPGPIFFTQKRLGQNKKYFKLHKFRSMKMSTPHDVPTHMLDNPDQYITKVGKFIRAHSLDELPQIWDIFVNNMSVIGPRPGLWNQDVLTAERDKYGANDVKPGLTGWAQINGRDELEIPDKARLDGEYAQKIGFMMDLKCFLGSLGVFGGDDSVVEGGTGEMAKAGRHYTDGKTDEELIGHIGFGEPVEVDLSATKKVLITGAGSYIGESFKNYAFEKYGNNFEIEEIDMIDGTWREYDFSKYDIVYHVAGIAHADVGNVSETVKAKYYAVNTDLAVEVAKKAKKDGVKEFIFMSSMIVYGDSAPYGKEKIINEYTVPSPANFYGDSKLQADVAIRSLADDKFKVIVLRPPMIYGKESKGNYSILAKLAKRFPVFPKVDNKRSMLHVDNLCEFLCQIMLVNSEKENENVFFPQNSEWTKTNEMIKLIASVNGKKIKNVKILGVAVLVCSKLPGKIGGLVNKAYGNNCYSYGLSQYVGINYQKIGLEESIERTEKSAKTKPKALIVASVASMIDQFNIPNIQLLLDNGYEVDVACNFVQGGNCTSEKIKLLLEKLKDMRVNAYQIDFDRNPFNILSDVYSLKQLEAVVNGKALSINSARLVNEGGYSIIHSHSPIGGIIGRVIGKKHGIKSIYTAHGFHFYRGGAIKNWIVYYPIEKIFSNITDVLITINKEDYEVAKKHFKQKLLYQIPGVGIDLKKFDLLDFDREAYRRIIGITKDDFMILSVGELNNNKNQALVIKSVAAMKNPKVHYFIVGIGQNKKIYEQLADSLNIREQIHLLGFRNDIAELNHIADVFAFPSIREGLGMAAIEALACGTPVCGMNTRGINEYVINGKTGYLFENNVGSCKKALEKALEEKAKFEEECKMMAQNYSCEKTNQIMKQIYTEV